MKNIFEVEFKGITFDVEIWYQPSEKQTRDYPGCAEGIEIVSVEFAGADFTEVLGDYDDDLTRLIFKQIHDK